MRDEDALAALKSGLADHDLTLADIDLVFVSHWHPDHAGLAGTVQRESDATVYAHSADADLVAQDDETWETMEDRQRDLLERWGLPEPIRKQVFAHAKRTGKLDGPAPTVESFGDGDRFDLGSNELEVVHSPGHSAGFSTFAFDGEQGRELLSGDALLPVVTPSVGAADVRLDAPLAAYLSTLERFVERNYARAWPGHRHAIDEPTARARAIYGHHRERAEEILDVLDDNGPADAWTVSGHLFGELEGIHVLHGPGESAAHLEHLADRDAVDRTGEEYELIERPDLDSVFGTLAPTA